MATQINKLHGLDWTPDDLDKKFRHAYLYAGIKQTDGTVKREVVYIHSAAESAGGSNCVLYTSMDDANGKTVPYSRFLVEEDRADPCITNLKNDNAFLYCYNPNRQWRRGWCADNSFLYIGPSISSLMHNHHWSFEIANLIYKPVHVHLTEAIDQFRSSEDVKGRALNNRYWLLRKTKDEPIQLFRRKCYLGSFIGKKFFISEDAKIFKDELYKELPILKEKYGYAQ